MRQPLISNQHIILTPISENNTKEYVIDELTGYGGSCLVYSAHHIDAKGNRFRVRIKEFYPSGLSIIRSSDGSLVFSDDVSDDLKRFEDGYKRQIEFRNNDEFTNSISNIQGIYTGYNTVYIVMDINVGNAYSKLTDESLQDCISVCLSTAKALKKYHDLGIVHLDVKPDNIFVYPETKEMIMLFDFDSVISLSDISEKTVLSSTPGWAAPELEQSNTKKICIQTDFYSVGAMLFSRIMDRMPNAMDGCSFTTWEYDWDKPLFKNVDPRAGKLLTAFFKKTITVSTKNRYQADDELISALEKLKVEANPQKRFLYSSLNFNKSFFVGREKELSEIHDALNENNVVFLSGIGGIGKSELAKRYGQIYRDEYDAIIFGMYTGSLMSFISDDRYIHINGYSRFIDEPEKDYFERKYRVLKELTNEKILFVIDSFDTENDSHLDEIISLGSKVIYTTRNSFYDLGYTQIDVSILGSQGEAEALFGYYYAITNEEKESVSELIKYVDRHTITIELLAKQCKASRIKPSKMLEKLKASGISTSGKEKVRINKDGRLSVESTLAHLHAIFDITDLTENQKYVLMNLSLLPPSGVSCEDFAGWCEIDNYDDINSLENSGWLRIDDETDYVSLHPIISELIYDELKPDSSPEKCEKMIKALTEWIKNYVLNFTSSILMTIITKWLLDKYVFLNVIDTILLHYINRFLIEILEKEYAQKGIETELKICEGFDLSLNYYVLNALNNKADFERDFNCNYSIAEHYYNLVINNKKSIEYTIILSQSLFGMGSICRLSSAYDKALEYYNKSLCLLSSNKNQRSLEIANIYNEIAMCYDKKGDYSKSIEYYDKTLAFTIDVLGEHHIYTSDLYNNIGSMYYNMHEYELSLEYCKKALYIIKKTIGEDSINSAFCYNNIGTTYNKMKMHNNALKYLTLSLELRKRILGEEHIDVSNSYYNIAILYTDIKDYKMAISFYNKALRIQMDILGSKNIIVKQTKDKIKYVKELSNLE